MSATDLMSFPARLGSPLPLTDEVKTAAERRLIMHQTKGQFAEAPAGYTLSVADYDLEEFLTSPDYRGSWDGPIIRGAGWRIATYWETGRGVIFYLDSEGDGGIPATEAANIAAAMAGLA